MYLIYAFYLFIYLVHKSKSKISRHLKTDYEKKKKLIYIHFAKAFAKPCTLRMTIQRCIIVN